MPAGVPRTKANEPLLEAAVRSLITALPCGGGAGTHIIEGANKLHRAFTACSTLICKTESVSQQLSLGGQLVIDCLLSLNGCASRHGALPHRAPVNHPPGVGW